jgi:hypothetical protein
MQPEVQERVGFEPVDLVWSQSVEGAGMRMRHLQLNSVNRCPRCSSWEGDTQSLPLIGAKLTFLNTDADYISGPAH